MTYDLAWLQDWASRQKFDGTNSSDISRTVLSEILSKYPDHSATFGPNPDGTEYHITLTGQMIQHETVIIPKTV
jgi:hypothetical protein